MPVFNEISEIGFDLEKAKSALHAYSRSIGMECSLIDSKGIYLYKSTFSSNLCPYCGKLQTLTKKQFNCSSVHLYGSYQAERFGGKYVYFCPIGLVHWASPITKDGKIQGALIGGPVLMVNPDDFLIDDLIKASGIPQSQIDDLKEYIDRVPVIHPNLVNSFSELLSIVASLERKGSF